MAKLNSRDLKRLTVVAELSHDKRTERLLQISRALDAARTKRADALKRQGCSISNGTQQFELETLAMWSNSTDKILPKIEEEIYELEKLFAEARRDAVEGFARLSNLGKLAEKATAVNKLTAAKKEEIALLGRSVDRPDV